MPLGDGRFLGYAVGRECLVEDTSFMATSGRETEPDESAMDGIRQRDTIHATRTVLVEERIAKWWLVNMCSAMSMSCRSRTRGEEQEKKQQRMVQMENERNVRLTTILLAGLDYCDDCSARGETSD
jgi:hypothetical protein